MFLWNAPQLDSRPVLCADDFGLSRGVSDGIVELISAGRLSATSALVTLDAWPHKASVLMAHARNVAVGLHVNLSLGAPLTRLPRLAPRGRFPSIASIIQLSYLGSLDPAEIAQEITAQFDAFESEFRRVPDFVDGHEHVHVLPGIRACLLTILRLRGMSASLTVRDPSDRAPLRARRPVASKRLIVRALASGFRSSVIQAGYSTNDSFAGFSTFSQDRPFSAEFETFLRPASLRHIIMCHPGFGDKRQAASPDLARRIEEFRYLSQRFGLAELVWHPTPRPR